MLRNGLDPPPGYLHGMPGLFEPVTITPTSRGKARRHSGSGTSKTLLRYRGTLCWALPQGLIAPRVNAAVLVAQCQQ